MMHQSAHTTSLIGFEVVHMPSDMKRFDLSSWQPNSMPFLLPPLYVITVTLL
jgi:hypothetical protein